MKTNIARHGRAARRLDVLDHYRHELQLAAATRDAQAAEKRAQLAVDEAHRQRKRADVLERKLTEVRRALGAA